MKILFDQGTPVPLRRHLHPGRVDTAAEMGWSELGNGELLAMALSRLERGKWKPRIQRINTD